MAQSRTTRWFVVLLLLLSVVFLVRYSARTAAEKSALWTSWDDAGTLVRAAQDDRQLASFKISDNYRAWQGGSNGQFDDINLKRA